MYLGGYSQEKKATPELNDVTILLHILLIPNELKEINLIGLIHNLQQLQVQQETTNSRRPISSSRHTTKPSIASTNEPTVTNPKYTWT